MDNKMYRKLIDQPTREKNVTWVNKITKAKIYFTEKEFESFGKKKLRKIFERGDQDGYVQAYQHTSKMTEMKLEYNISTYISYNESMGSFPLLPDVLREFDKKGQSELPQVIAISEYA